MEVPVPQRLTHPHPFVVRLRDVSTPKRQPREPFDWRSGYRPVVLTDRLRPLDVSRASLLRALRIMQALISESERRGYVVREPTTSGIRDVCVVIDGHSFAITISEKEEKLRVWLAQAWGGRRQWNDGPRGLVEGKLDDVLVSLEARAGELEEQRRAHEEEQRRREEARERALEVARERFAEAFRADVLLRQMADRRLAKEIRTFCQELRQAIDEDANPQVNEWLAWAEYHADSIDPVLHPPTMPAVPEARTEDLRLFLPEAGLPVRRISLVIY
jgi:hypothetical protein